MLPQPTSSLNSIRSVSTNSENNNISNGFIQTNRTQISGTTNRISPNLVGNSNSHDMFSGSRAALFADNSDDEEPRHVTHGGRNNRGSRALEANRGMFRVNTLFDRLYSDNLSETSARNEIRETNYAKVASILGAINTDRLEAKIDLERFRPYPEFCRFIQELPRTAMYANNKQEFLTRAYNMLLALQLDSDLFKDVVDDIGHAMGHCHDRIQIYFILAEVKCLNHQILHTVKSEGYDIYTLLELGKGMYRLNEVPKMANNRIAELFQKHLNSSFNETKFSVDEVEMYLGIYMNFRDLLPIKVYAMGFSELTELTQEVVNSMRHHLTDSDNSQLLKFLTAWPPMQQLLKQVDPENYEKISIKIQDEKTKIMDEVIKRTEELNQNLASNALPDCKDSKMQELEREYRNVEGKIALDYLKTFFENRHMNPQLNN